MAKSVSERQASYRKRKREGDTDFRLDTWISSDANEALNRLAAYHSISKREMLERLLANTDRAIANSLSLDGNEKKDYYRVSILTK